MKKLRIVVLILLAVMYLLAFTLPVYAQAADPDSTPTIERLNVYRNLLESGDFFIVWLANIPYSVATQPDAPVTETFIWRLIDTDGITELGYTTGYAYNDDGYGYNVYCMYFSFSTAPAWKPAVEYTLRLSGNPAQFVTPPEYIFTVSTADYTALTGTTDNQEALATTILWLGDELDQQWALTAANSLLLEIEAGTVLSIDGESYFRGAIYGLQGLAPTVFRVILRDINVADRTWSGNYSTIVGNQWAGTWVGNATTAGAGVFSQTYDLFAIVGLIIICLVFAVGDVSLTSDMWNAFAGVSLIALAGAKLAVYSMGFLGLAVAVAVLYLSARVWGIAR